MKIFLRCPGTLNDWCILELQGEVSVDGLADDFNHDGLQFADISEQNVRNPLSTATKDDHSSIRSNLAIVVEQGKAVLKIGQHELRGTSVKLDKPLAVLRRVTLSQNPPNTVGSGLGNLEYCSQTSYEVVGVVRHKFLFKDRPKVLLDPVSV